MAMAMVICISVLTVVLLDIAKDPILHGNELMTFAAKQQSSNRAREFLWRNKRCVFSEVGLPVQTFDCTQLSVEGLGAQLEKIRQGKPLHEGDRVLKILLMTRDEGAMLRTWVEYHRKLFGLPNLYILDGSRNHLDIAFLRGVRAAGCNVLFTKADLQSLGRTMTKVMLQLRGAADFLIKLDTDEFLSIKDGGPRSVQSYLNSLPYPGCAYNVRWWKMATAPERCSAEGQPKTITSFAATTDMPSGRPKKKVMYAAPTFARADLGGHRAGVIEEFSGKVIMVDLMLFHYHCQCFNDYVRETERVMLSHRYIDSRDNIRIRAEQAGVICKSHRPSWHKACWYQAYLLNATEAERNHTNCGGKAAQADTSIKDFLFLP